MNRIIMPPVSQIHGIYSAVVVSVNDPLKQNRVQLQIPQVLGTAVSNWAKPLSQTTGTSVPSVGSVVMALFIGGDRNNPAYMPPSWTTNGGTAVLSSGTVTVSSTIVTANSRILLTAQDNNTTGALRVSARSAGVSFTITSSVGTDSGVVAYQIF